MYEKFGFLKDSGKVFDRMPERNLVTWNSLIYVFSENEFLWGSVLICLWSWLGDGLVPDVATLVTVLPVCDGEKEVSLRKLIHSLAVKLGFFRDLKSGSDGVKPDRVTVLNVLKLCFHRSKLLKVKELHVYSIRHGIESDELVANAFIAAYAKCEC
ncbi:pentatricopeptide repeat-containing protein, partial [Tanacetum coccineum]